SAFDPVSALIRINDCATTGARVRATRFGAIPAQWLVSAVSTHETNRGIASASYSKILALSAT
ncbi:MAG: hypothetical protein ACXW3X_07800, partial [Rhodoplanes sp.]